MTTPSPTPSPASHPPSVTKGLLVYAGYLAVFFTTWAINGADYNRIGANAETTRLWYAFPTLFGCAFLAVALSVLGWWRAALFDTTKSGPRWVWLLPVAMGGIIVNNFIGLPFDRLSGELLLWSSLGAIGVGFGEEMITRGALIVGLRSRFGEAHVSLISSLLFSALHIPDVLFGLPFAMPIQVLLTFIMAGGFYAIRRLVRHAALADGATRALGQFAVPERRRGPWALARSRSASLSSRDCLRDRGPAATTPRRVQAGVTPSRARPAPCSTVRPLNRRSVPPLSALPSRPSRTPAHSPAHSAAC